MTYNVDSFKQLFEIQFAHKQSSIRMLQEQSYIYFLDFLDNCIGEFSIACIDNT